MDYNFVTQPFTARHVRFTKQLGFGSLGTYRYSRFQLFMGNFCIKPGKIKGFNGRNPGYIF